MVMQFRRYRYRLYPSHKQEKRLINSFKVCKQIYNELLEASIKSFKETKKIFKKSDYNKLLKKFKGVIYSQVKYNVRDRIINAYSNFFRKVKDKSCGKKGFPRFKSRVRSITYTQAINKGYRNGFWFINNKNLHATKIGNIPIILHRVPKGKIKTLTIKQNKAGQWFATFVCEMPEVQVKCTSTEKVGIDVGLENFATLSNGEVITNPKFIIKSEKRIKLLNRQLSRKKKGGRNRSKARFRLARQHLKVANQRIDFLHKLSHKLTMRFNSIVVEDLNVVGMVKNHRLANHIYDASWYTFIKMLEYKAVTSGSTITKVNPRNTSKTCSSCGTINEMPLSKRSFLCSNCGLSCHRDLNASINVLKVGMDCTELNACGDSTPTLPNGKASGINEAGTTLDNT